VDDKHDGRADWSGVRPATSVGTDRLEKCPFDAENNEVVDGPIANASEPGSVDKSRMLFAIQ
jgi:hypothetical protein